MDIETKILTLLLSAGVQAQLIDKLHADIMTAVEEYRFEAYCKGSDDGYEQGQCAASWDARNS